MAVRARGNGPGTHGPSAGTLQGHFLSVGRTGSGFAAPQVKPGSREEVAGVLRASAAGAGLPAAVGACTRLSPLAQPHLPSRENGKTVTSRAGRSVAAAHTEEPGKYSFPPVLSEFPKRSGEKKAVGGWAQTARAPHLGRNL